MYLRLEIEGEESFHPFPDKDRVTIGRSPTCDIQIMADGISRYHLEIHEKLGGECYAIDKGSTHGSFINEEQLVKDKPVAFNSFFPARLGSNVYVYLMDEAVSVAEDLIDSQESLNPPAGLEDVFKEEQTPVSEDQLPPPPKAKDTFNLDPPKTNNRPKVHVPTTAGKVTDDMEKLLKKSQRAGASSKKGSKKSKKKGVSARKKKEKKQKMFSFILIAFVIGFTGYKQWQKIEAQKQVKLQEELQKLAAIKRIQEKEQKEQELRLKEQKILEEQKKQAESIKTIVDRDKCLTDEEVAFCNILKANIPRTYKEGAVKELSTIYLIINSSKTYDKYKDLKYSKQDLSKVFAQAQKKLGRRFHAGMFEKRQNLRMPKPKEDVEYFNLMALADFITTFKTGLPDVTGFKKLIIIAIDNEDRYKSNYVYDIQKLKNAKIEDSFFAAHLAFRSYIFTKLKFFQSKFKFITKKNNESLKKTESL